jgi:hypothetical protein
MDFHPEDNEFEGTDRYDNGGYDPGDFADSSYGDHDGITADDEDADEIPEDLPDAIIDPSADYGQEAVIDDGDDSDKWMAEKRDVEATDVSGEPEEIAEDSILNLPEAEQEEVAAELELFAVGGEQYADVHEKGDQLETGERGYVRSIPQSALLAEGIEQQVEISTTEATGVDEPFAVGFLATREVGCEREIQLPDGSDRKMLVSTTGLETKVAGFFFEPTHEGPPTLRLRTRTTLMAPVEPAKGDGSPQESNIIDDPQRYMRIEELRAIVRAIRRTYE